MSTGMTKTYTQFICNVISGVFVVFLNSTPRIEIHQFRTKYKHNFFINTKKLKIQTHTYTYTNHSYTHIHTNKHTHT